MLRRLVFLVLLLALAACGGVPTRPEALPPEPPPAREAVPVARPVDYGLAPGFAANAGRLPWPATGTVVGFFGRRTDPATGTVTDAVGVDIATSPEAPVRSVFGGRVSRVGSMAAFGTYVMLKHNGWTTVYGNLSYVNVQAGDSLGVGAVLGAAGSRDDRRGSSLFFAVFEGDAPVDPIRWLRPRGSEPESFGTAEPAAVTPEASASETAPAATPVPAETTPQPERPTPIAAPAPYVPQPLKPASDTTRSRRGGW